MGNACKGNLLRLQSCFLVVESFSMFHVKHDVSTTIQLFHVKRWLFFVVGGGRVLGFKHGCVGVGGMRLWKVGLCFSSG